jgi:hypothetical protein
MRSILKYNKHDEIFLSYQNYLVVDRSLQTHLFLQDWLKFSSLIELLSSSIDKLSSTPANIAKCFADSLVTSIF